MTGLLATGQLHWTLLVAAHNLRQQCMYMLQGVERLGGRLTQVATASRCHFMLMPQDAVHWTGTGAMTVTIWPTSSFASLAAYLMTCDRHWHVATQPPQSPAAAGRSPGMQFMQACQAEVTCGQDARSSIVLGNATVW